MYSCIPCVPLRFCDLQVGANLGVANILRGAWTSCSPIETPVEHFYARRSSWREYSDLRVTVNRLLGLQAVDGAASIVERTVRRIAARAAAGAVLAAERDVAGLVEAFVRQADVSRTSAIATLPQREQSTTTLVGDAAPRWPHRRTVVLRSVVTKYTVRGISITVVEVGFKKNLGFKFLNKKNEET